MPDPIHSMPSILTLYHPHSRLFSFPNPVHTEIISSTLTKFSTADCSQQNPLPLPILRTVCNFPIFDLLFHRPPVRLNFRENLFVIAWSHVTVPNVNFDELLLKAVEREAGMDAIRLGWMVRKMSRCRIYTDQNL